MEPPRSSIQHPLFTQASSQPTFVTGAYASHSSFFLTATYYQLATTSKPKADKPRQPPSTMKLCITPSPTLSFIFLLLALSSYTTAFPTDQDEALHLPNQILVHQSSPSSSITTTTASTSSLSLLSRLVLPYQHLIHPRSPVEVPPTEYLPYPPPPNYIWPPGTSAATEDPQPSEFDPPPGFYTDARVGSDSSSDGSTAGGGQRNGDTVATSQGARIRPFVLFWGFCWFFS